MDSETRELRQAIPGYNEKYIRVNRFLISSEVTAASEARISVVQNSDSLCPL